MLEAALHYCEALEAADRAALFKTFTKVLAQRHGLMATFMAKWSNSCPGQSGHLHISLDGKDGESRLPRRDEAARACRDAMRWFVGGQQALMPELLAMVACTVNSYSRLVPGFWAPTSATWGVENRTSALRVIRGGAPKPARRVPDRRRRYQSLYRAGRRHRLRACGASSIASSRMRRSRAMPTTASSRRSGVCRAP